MDGSARTDIVTGELIDLRFVGALLTLLLALGLGSEGPVLLLQVVRLLVVYMGDIVLPIRAGRRRRRRRCALLLDLLLSLLLLGVLNLLLLLLLFAGRVFFRLALSFSLRLFGRRLTPALSLLRLSGSAVDHARVLIVGIFFRARRASALLLRHVRRLEYRRA